LLRQAAVHQGQTPELQVLLGQALTYFELK
jgi:hypothetical protein